MKGELQSKYFDICWRNQAIALRNTRKKTLDAPFAIRRAFRLQPICVVVPVFRLSERAEPRFRWTLEETFKYR